MQASGSVPPHILFVDDEPNMLAALRRMLRARRNVWKVSFAGGAHEALEIMSVSPCDVIISDYRMPGVDGGALLETVRDRYPATGRLILSGQIDESCLLKVLLLAHQYLSKPCTEADIVGAVERVLALRTMLPDDDLAEQIVGGNDLPDPPDALIDLFAVLNSPRAAKSAAAEMTRDASIAAKVLRVVNMTRSEGPGTNIETIDEAVSMLGARDIYALVLVHDLVDSFAPNGAMPPDESARFIEHAVQTSRLARDLAGEAPWADDAFAGGLLHEVGQLLVARCRPEMFNACRAMWLPGGGSLSVTERATLGTDHAAIGVYLLNGWGLPLAVIEAVAGHDSPAETAVDPTDPTSAVALAHTLVEAEYGAICGEPGDRRKVDESSLSPATQRKIELWRRTRVSASQAV